MTKQKEKGNRFFSEEDAQSILGKTLLVGVTYKNNSEEIIEVEQFYGTIIRASEKEGIIIRLGETGEERWVPPDLAAIETAIPGHYHLKSTGEVIINPDLLTTWIVHLPSNK